MEMTTTRENLQIPPPNAMSWGSRLRAMREANHLSAKEVAARLHLKPELILTIETEAFHETPSTLFMRGYVRSYARLLNLPDHEIEQALRHFGLDAPAATTISITHRTNVKPEINYAKWGTLIIILLLMTLTFTWWQTHASFTSDNDRVAQASTDNIATPPQPTKTSNNLVNNNNNAQTNSIPIPLKTAPSTTSNNQVTQPAIPQTPTTTQPATSPSATAVTASADAPQAADKPSLATPIPPTSSQQTPSHNNLSNMQMALPEGDLDSEQ